jgi:hypothetical protein
MKFRIKLKRFATARYAIEETTEVVVEGDTAEEAARLLCEAMDGDGAVEIGFAWDVVRDEAVNVHIDDITFEGGEPVPDDTPVDWEPGRGGTEEGC